MTIDRELKLLDEIGRLRDRVKELEKENEKLKCVPRLSDTYLENMRNEHANCVKETLQSLQRSRK